MATEYHILNGDQLLAQLPPELSGVRIVMRECLIDGPVAADTLEEFYKMRARFLTTEYPIGTIEEYHKKVVTEFERIQNIPPNSNIYLWFEDDLFCQVNCWFVLALLQDRTDCQLYLIRPDTRSPYAFSAYSSEELKGLHKQGERITSDKSLSFLWKAYTQKDPSQLQELAHSLSGKHPHILAAVAAHASRIPTDAHPGVVIETLKEIVKELETDAFEPIFQSFQKRLPIYGFGDLQLRRLLDNIH